MQAESRFEDIADEFVRSNQRPWNINFEIPQPIQCAMTLSSFISSSTSIVLFQSDVVELSFIQCLETSLSFHSRAPFCLFNNEV